VSRPSFAPGGATPENVAVARALRAEFPAFGPGGLADPAGRPVSYLDNAATTQKPRAVLEAMEAVYREACANVHRAIHTPGEEATRRYEAARSRIARFIGAGRRELVFTRGTTESINLVARTFGETLGPGDEVVFTEMEHHANIVPWQQLAQRRGVTLRVVHVRDDGTLDMDEYERLLSRRTRLVAVTMASNVLGTVNPVTAVAERARAVGALTLVDAAQAAPRMRLDAKTLGVDFLAFSAHKLYGPFGIGALWAREELLESLPPFLGGGEMIREVRLDGFEPNELPYKFEAGTPPIAEAVGFGAAAEWLDAVGLEALGAYESALAARLSADLRGIPGVRILGDAPSRAGIVAFAVDGVHAHDLSAYLDERGIAVRAGHHCAHPLAARFGVASSARASFGAYNEPAEAARLAELVARAKEEL
jgi:cysteine desulfurase/selenocysteine lyase